MHTAVWAEAANEGAEQERRGAGCKDQSLLQIWLSALRGRSAVLRVLGRDHGAALERTIGNDLAVRSPEDTVHTLGP